MNWKESLYYILINRVPGIRTEYNAYRNCHKGWQRILAWGYLGKLNFRYYILRDRTIGSRILAPDQGRKIAEGSESSHSLLPSPEEKAKELEKYDVISFDVFDTLILRRLKSPEAVFYLTQQDLGYPDLKNLRVEAERKARKIKQQTCGTYEVTFKEIWTELEKRTGIPAEAGMDCEWQNELKTCYANPYFLQLTKILKESGKKMVICSDMYLGEEKIRELLSHCGYPEFDAYFISSDCGKSKVDGTMFRFMKQQIKQQLKAQTEQQLKAQTEQQLKPQTKQQLKLQTKQLLRTHAGKKLSYIHVGDNEFSDVKKAKENGFSSFYYPNVQKAGDPFRAKDMSPLICQGYCGLVNGHLHNGLKAYDPAYEFGFVYGGLFATGYCQYIHDFVKKNRIERILFLARDGDILQQVYQKMYPEEKDLTRYVLWSRLAGTKLCAKYFRHFYLERMLHHKVDQNYTLRQIFRTMECEKLLEEFLTGGGKKDGNRSIRTGSRKSDTENVILTDRNLPKKKGRSNYTEETILTSKNVHKKSHNRGGTRYSEDTLLTRGNLPEIEEFLQENWQEVCRNYEEELSEAGKYYAAQLGGAKSAVIVDVGWVGSGIFTLKTLIEKEWEQDCTVWGLVAGTPGGTGVDMDTTAIEYANGTISSYLFSAADNRDVWKIHDAAKGHNMIVELLLSSPQHSFRGFGRGQNGEYRFSDTHETIDAVAIQKGILDFTGLWMESPLQKLRISGRDAMAPILLLYQNEDYIKEILKTSGIRANIE